MARYKEDLAPLSTFLARLSVGETPEGTKRFKAMRNEINECRIRRNKTTVSLAALLSCEGGRAEVRCGAFKP